jgi:hypothetical protein
MVDSVSSPMYATAVGLVKYAARHKANAKEDGKSPSLISNVVTGIRKLFK